MGIENQKPTFKAQIDKLFGYKGTGQEFENFFKVILTFFKGLINFDTNDVASRVWNNDPPTGPRPSHAPFAFLERGTSNVMPNLRDKFQPTADVTPRATTPPATPSAATTSTSVRPAVVDPNKDFTKAADNKPPCLSTLSVQMTGTEHNANNTLVATGKLALIDASGKEHTFPFKSGGWGKYGDDSMLPGLKDKQGVSYQLDWNSLIVKSKDLKPSMLGPDGTGSWIALGSNRQYTDRGQPLGSKEKGFFGIHVDGPNNPAATGGKGNEGSEGCVVLNAQDADTFFSVLQSIPINQRPTALTVDPPALTVATAPKVKAATPAA